MNSPDINFTQSVPTPRVTKPNPFDPEALRIDTTIQHVIVNPILLNVSVEKPNKADWFRTRPSKEWLPVAIFELKGDGTYLLTPDVANIMADDGAIDLVDLVQTVNRQGVSSLWPLKRQQDGGRQNPWLDSARKAAALANSKWTRMCANMFAGRYNVSVTEGITDKPIWPDKPMMSLLEIAFRGRLIESVEHPIIQQLLGQA